jgi:hypothetical protein
LNPRYFAFIHIIKASGKPHTLQGWDERRELRKFSNINSTISVVEQK